MQFCLYCLKISGYALVFVVHTKLWLVLLSIIIIESKYYSIL